MSRIIKIFAFVGIVFGVADLISAEDTVYRMCVPHIYYNDCVDLVKEPSKAGLQMKCVSGRDRMECLEKVNLHEADVIAVDPEDMYVAYHMNNQNFKVVSEIRTQVEKDAEFRYEGVILVKKSAKISSLEDLRGLKSCHTGFGRNVGYKIPITKLKNNGVLKVNLDPELAPTERELKALSEFFTKSCLVGTYSPHAETDKALKQKYSNLCAICEKPEQCNYPDKYSGYEGAIRCLAEGQGDVAFTKTSFIKKYFGLIPIETKPEGNPDDFEYLCEDGSRKPLSGPACSWAQRPWQGYMTNNDVKEQAQLERLQKRINTFYKKGQETNENQRLENLLIKSDLVLHEKSETIQPKEYLERAGYKDVIERDGSMSQKITLCVFNDIALKKCEVLKEAAYSRDIRPEFKCIKHTEDECIKYVHEQKADAVVLTGDNYKNARDANLKPVVYESYGDNVYVAVVDTNLIPDVIKKAAVNYDGTDKRAQNAAKLFNLKRDKPACNQEENSGSGAQVQIVKAKELEQLHDKKIVCPNFELKPTSEYQTCNFEASLPNAVFIRDGLTEHQRNNIVHAFISLSQRFGHKGKLEDVFEIFDEFQPGAKNIIFNDDTIELVTEFKPSNGVNEQFFQKELQCH